MPSPECVAREQALRRAVLAGDAAAWRAWYDESFDGLHAYVAWRCRGLNDLVDDVVQQTWMVAVRRVRRFDPEQGRFADWLRGIAANVLRNHFRRTVRRSSPLPRAVAPDAQASQETAECVARALALLPERYEAVLRAKYLGGQSVDAIAAANGESPKAVESLLTRARLAFREAYSHPE
jgi:RNA polymerase sigma-70 factor (ECF subfamily)